MGGWAITDSASISVEVTAPYPPPPPPEEEEEKEKTFWDYLKEYFEKHPEMLMFVGMMGMMMFTTLIVAISR